MIQVSTEKLGRLIVNNYVIECATLYLIARHSRLRRSDGFLSLSLFKPNKCTHAPRIAITAEREKAGFIAKCTQAAAINLRNTKFI